MVHHGAAVRPGHARGARVAVRVVWRRDELDQRPLRRGGRRRGGVVCRPLEPSRAEEGRRLLVARVVGGARPDARSGLILGGGERVEGGRDELGRADPNHHLTPAGRGEVLGRRAYHCRETLEARRTRR